jgi:thiol-disulfide isomerase/thioredoxin
MVETMSRMIGGADMRDREVPVIFFPQLQEMVAHESDTTFVYNFWATWCSPCVKEFPQFQELESKFPGKKIRVIFVSLDFLKDRERTLEPFVEKHNVTNPVYLLDEPDYNVWIDQLDSSWEGNLPATLVVNNSKHLRRFYPQEFGEGQLADSVKQFVN